MTDGKYLLGALAILLLVIVCDVSWGFIKKRGRYILKKNINGLRPMLVIIWSAYFLLGAAALVSPIVKWVRPQLLKYPEGSTSYLTVSWLPDVFVLSALYLVGIVIVRSFQPWFKYTDTELDLLRKDKERLWGEIRRIVPWLRK